MNEFQLAFQHSRSQFQPHPDHEKVEQLRAMGLWVVEEGWEATCGVTDALLGYSYALVAAFAAESDAQAFVDSEGRGWDDAKISPPIGHEKPKEVVEETQEPITPMPITVTDDYDEIPF